MDEWEKHNEKIRTLFFSTIHEMHKIRIANHTSTWESWNMLCKLYERQGELHAQSLVDHMHALKFPKGQHDPCLTLDQLDLLIADHASTSSVLTDSEKKNIVLHLLSSSWHENIRSILMNTESMCQLAVQLNPSGISTPPTCLLTPSVTSRVTTPRSMAQPTHPLVRCLLRPLAISAIIADIR
jgi:hypothetical protein